MKKINWNYKMTLNQERLSIFALNNFFFGIMFMAITESIIEYFKFGLWHKILIFNNINIPIGILSMILLVCSFTFVTLTVLLFNYKVLTEGLEFIEIKEDKKEVTQIVKPRL